MQNQVDSTLVSFGIRLLHTLGEDSTHATELSWSPSGRLLAFVHNGRSAIVFDANSREMKPAQVIHEEKCLFSDPAAVAESLIRGLTWSEDEKRIIVTSLGGEVQLFSSESADGQFTLKNRVTGLESTLCAWSTSGNRLALLRRDGSLVLQGVQGDFVHLSTKLDIVTGPESSPIAKSSTTQIYEELKETLSNRVRHEFGNLYHKYLTESLSATSDLSKGTLRAYLLQQIGLLLAWSKDNKRIVSLTWDGSVRMWNSETGRPDQLIRGQSRHLGFAWSPDSRFLAIGCSDATIRVHNVENGQEVDAIEGHTSAVRDLSFSPSGNLLASKAGDGTIRLWRCDTWDVVSEWQEPGAAFQLGVGLTFHPSQSLLASLRGDDRGIGLYEVDEQALLARPNSVSSTKYVNAKVVLVGNSGVGKSALGIRIAEKKWKLTESTHSTQVWQLAVPKNVLPKQEQILEAGVTLWDLAGQPGYRITHQLFLDDTDVALLLFDGSDPHDPFRGVQYWAKVLRKRLPSHAARILVSARTDVSPVTVDQKQIQSILDEFELTGYASTCSKTGAGIKDLWEKTLTSIPWGNLTRTSTPRLFQVIRRSLLERQRSEASPLLISMEDIQTETRRHYRQADVTEADIETVVNLLQARGLAYGLRPATGPKLVLLRPEMILRYGSSIVQAAGGHPQGIGAVSERSVLAAEIKIFGFDRLALADERLILESTVELLISHNLCFREMGMLVFPSQISVTRQETDNFRPTIEVRYRFSGDIETIYASLVVRLYHTSHFQREDQWRYVVEFSRNGHRLGFMMRQVDEGIGMIDVYFAQEIDEFDRALFVHFIKDHLIFHGIEVEEQITVICTICRNEVIDTNAIRQKIENGQHTIPCQYCSNGTEIEIPGSLEDKYRKEIGITEQQKLLAQHAALQTACAVIGFQHDSQEYMQPESETAIQILHLSDFRISTQSQAETYRTQLETDLATELGIKRLEYLVITGDIAMRSTPEEYEAAFGLVDGLTKRFGLDPSRIVIVPGNHDLNWDLSASAYSLVPRHKVPSDLPADTYVEAGPAGLAVRDDEIYRHRFDHFNGNLYKKVFNGSSYPLDYEDQGILLFRPQDKILFLTLNSCWHIDHLFPDRSGISPSAIAKAIDKLQNGYENWLKIAAFHHPTTGKSMMNDDFMQLLAVHGFQVCLHGHVREAKHDLYTHDANRGIHIVGAGTFGDRTADQPSVIPLQYNLLALDPMTRTLTVETRKKEKPDGAWMADARWGDKNNPSPRYTIHLKNWEHPDGSKP